METRVSQKEIGCLMVSPSLRGGITQAAVCNLLRHAVLRLSSVSMPNRYISEDFLLPLLLILVVVFDKNAMGKFSSIWNARFWRSS